MSTSTISISGAHRVGKSTLAKTISGYNGIHYLETGVSSCSVWSKYNITPSTQLSPELRYEVQSRISDFLFEKFEKQKEPFITDRSFIDVAAYLYHGTWRAIDMAIIDAALRRLLAYQNSVFSHTFLLQPGIEIVAAPGKEDETFLKRSTQDELNKIFISLGEYDVGGFHVIPESIMSLDDRANFVCCHSNLTQTRKSFLLN